MSYQKRQQQIFQVIELRHWSRDYPRKENSFGKTIAAKQSAHRTNRQN